MQMMASVLIIIIISQKYRCWINDKEIHINSVAVTKAVLSVIQLIGANILAVIPIVTAKIMLVLELIKFRLQNKG